MLDNPKQEIEETNAKPLVPFTKVSAAIRNYLFPNSDLVIGIGNGGIIPATLIAHHLGLPLKLVRVNYRDETNQPQREEPEFLSSLELKDLSTSTRILLVDDVGVTGKTIEKVKKALSQFHVETLVVKGKADHVLIPDLKTCVTWPWSIK